MLDSAHSDQQKDRSALIAHELSGLNVDIAALGEALFPEGCLQ